MWGEEEEPAGRVKRCGSTAAAGREEAAAMAAAEAAVAAGLGRLAGEGGVEEGGRAAGRVRPGVWMGSLPRGTTGCEPRAVLLRRSVSWAGLRGVWACVCTCARVCMCAFEQSEAAAVGGGSGPGWVG